MLFVSELGGILDFNRYSAVLFDHILPGQTSQVRRTASGNYQPVKSFNPILYRFEAAKFGKSVFYDQPPPDGVLNRFRLLMNFFEHKMRELLPVRQAGIFLDFILRPLYEFLAAGYGFSVQCGDTKIRRCKDRKLSVVKINNLPCVR